jgi:excisionase family DNA binding protein
MRSKKKQAAPSAISSVLREPVSYVLRQHLTTHEIASLLEFDPSTVSKWVDRGLLGAFRTPGGHRRIGRLDLIAFLRAHQMPVPAALGAEPAKAEAK